MNNGLEKIRIIDTAKLHSELYFESLLEEAHSKELLSDSDIERMQYECLSLLAYQTERFNSGDSSSIRVEKAQDIMASILFTIGVALKTYSNPDDAAALLKQTSVNEIYKTGRNRIEILIAATKVIHTKLLSRLIDTKNHFYSDTIADGILGFFKLYDPDYAAQEIHITVDYPLFNPMPKLLGIEFIKAYVQAAYSENQLCSYFAADDIHHLLCGYAEEYQGLLINIYEQIVTAAIGSIAVGIDPSRLDITEVGAQFLCQTFTGESKNKILTTITKAADELNRQFQFSQELIRYVHSSLPLIASNIEAAARRHMLKRVFFPPAFPENNPKIVFSYGDKMEDELYRKVIAEIVQCRYIHDKMAIIKEYIHSLADLEDVLLDAELTGEEIGNVLRELTLPEIAALSKKYPLDHNGFELREQEQLLRRAIQIYLSALSQVQRDLVEKASKALDPK